MAIKYSLHETPVPSGRKKKVGKHARIIQEQKVDMEKMCKLVSAGSTFSSADVKGVLEAFQFWMGKLMTFGDSFELEGLGHFYPTLKSKSYINKKGKETVDVWVDTVGFRCSPKLKRLIRSADLSHVQQEEKVKLTVEQRHKNILWHAKKHGYVDATKALAMNGGFRRDALADLRKLMQEGKLKNIGTGNQLVCVLRES